MAVTNYSGLIQEFNTTGVKITKVCDSQSDWSSISNGVYFYDKSFGIPFYKTSTGIVVNPFTNPLQDYIVYKQLSNVTVTNTVTETSLLTNKITIPANYFAVGNGIDIDLRGFHSTSGNPNVTVKIKLGSTIILNTGVVSSGNGTDFGLEIEAMLTCRSIGVSGTISGQGQYIELMTSPNLFSMVNTSPITLDTTISQDLDVTVQWGVASASDSMTLTDGTIRIV